MPPHTPTDALLAKARRWRVKDTREHLEEARDLLLGGLKADPGSLPLVDELLLVYDRLGDDAAAAALLQTLGQGEQLTGDETLCRIGKRHKKLGQQAHDADPAAAAAHYADAEKYYALAFAQLRTFYPKINELTVRCMRAGVALLLKEPAESAELYAQAKRDVDALLADRGVWVRKLADDRIWVPATKGEAHLLRGDSHSAKYCYDEAIREAGGETFYRRCMRDQVRMLARVLLPLGVKFEHPLNDPDKFFDVPPPALEIA